MMNKPLIYSNIIRQHETPFYVFDEIAFIENMQNLFNALSSIYPKYKIAYSYKTNYTPYICKLAKLSGAYAEVVSDMELALAMKLGYPNDHIIYNGPQKGEMLEQHICNNGLVNIDNLSEAIRVSSIAKSHSDKNFEVGLRINMHLDDAFISRFGLEMDSQDMSDALSVLRNTPNISIVGLHCHISRHRGLDAWNKRSLIMIEAARKCIDGIPKYISLGSGMFADMPEELKIQFGSNVPSYTEYAEATMRPFIQEYGSYGPIIFTEPGTTVVGRYIDFVTTVKNIKTVRGRRMAILNGSFENLGEICGLKKLPVVNLSNNDMTENEKIDLVGYTCLEQDLMVGDYPRPINVGDNLAFLNVGAYSIVSKPQFIHPNCPMYAIDKNGATKEIMRAETFDDVFSKFIF